MKKLTFLLAVCLLAFVTDSSAQFTNTGASITQTDKSQTSGGGFLSNMTTENYGRWYVNYNPVKLKWQEHQDNWEETIPMKHGFTVGFLGGVNLTSKAPIYFEYGLNYQGSFGKRDEDGFAIKTSLHSLNIPLNFAFRLSFNDNKISVTPYVGLNGRINLAGSLKYDYDDFVNDYGYEDEKLDLFNASDTDEDGVGKQAFKRFQVGMNLGIGFSFSAFYIGVGHTFDFSKIANYEAADYVAKLGVTHITLGINF